tara:strand:- start:1338 stop:1466 length:129 start_codon:yes stop_codon:yes gene_type:complete
MEYLIGVPLLGMLLWYAAGTLVSLIKVAESWFHYWLRSGPIR